MSDTVRVWRITPSPNTSFDSLVFSNAEDAGIAAANHAEILYDDYALLKDGNPNPHFDPLEPGTPVQIECVEMSREEFEALGT